MPHSREVQTTSHDRHDPMLVAALAGGDLAGTDREGAVALTRACSDCSALHDDLVALARATAAAPPPSAFPARDFRLTPADAARLRPNARGRLVAAIRHAPTAASRPLGVGLATIGLVGLLFGNVHLGSLGLFSASSAGLPAATAGPAAQFEGNPDVVAAPTDATSGAGAGVAPQAAGSAAPPSSAPAAAPTVPGAYGAASDAAGVGGSRNEAAVTGSGKALGLGAPGTRGAADLAETPAPEPGKPLNLLFGGAMILGLGILVAGGLRGRRAL